MLSIACMSLTCCKICNGYLCCGKIDQNSICTLNNGPCISAAYCVLSGWSSWFLVVSCVDMSPSILCYTMPAFDWTGDQTPRPRIYRPRTHDFLLSFSCFIQQLLMSLINLSGKFKFKAMIWTHWQPPYRRCCWASVFKGVLGLLIRCLWSNLGGLFNKHNFRLL